MAVDLICVACLSDNYAYLVHDDTTGATALFDVPDAQPIRAALDARGWRLTHVFLTHHHWDHVDGLPALLETHPAPVYGGRNDKHRLPPLTHEVDEPDRLPFGEDHIDVISVPGHTTGHLAYHLPKSRILVTMDSLMALGCGRLFECGAEIMQESLKKLAALPRDTRICSGHEYAATNARFALGLEPGNRALISRSRDIDTARAEGRATVPTTLELELATNPFLRTDSPEIQANLGLPGATPETVFAELRRRRDDFK